MGKLSNRLLMSLSQETILNDFASVDALLKGHFILSSGRHSDTYLQCARVLMHPLLAAKLCTELARKLEENFGKNAFDRVVAPAMGGVVVGYEMGRQLNIPTIFCERVDGNFTLRRGFDLNPNDRILIVEDVVTTGKSSIETLHCIQELKGNVIAEASLVNRDSGGKELLAKHDIPLVSLLELHVESYAADELPPHLKDIPAVKPGSRHLKV